MGRAFDRFCRLLDFLSAACLFVMVILVFGNVVLRYGFNSGITISEELSRWLFVWLTFMAAIVAVREHGHLGVDMLVSRLPPAGKKICLAIGLILMLLCCWLIFWGSYEQTMINLDVEAPATGLSTGWFYGVGMLFSVFAAIFLLTDLVRLITGRMRDDELVQVKESEESAELEELQKRMAREDAAAATPGRDRGALPGDAPADAPTSAPSDAPRGAAR